MQPVISNKSRLIANDRVQRELVSGYLLLHKIINMVSFHSNNSLVEEFKPIAGEGTFPVNVMESYNLSGDMDLSGEQNPIDWNDCDDMMDRSVQEWNSNGGPGFHQSPISDHSSGSSNTEMQTNQLKNGTADIPVAANDTEANEKKRKAQNRAAQRAFRERKEQRVKELEQRLVDAENEIKRLTTENEVLKKENTILMTENQVIISAQSRSNKGDHRHNNFNNNTHIKVPMTVSFPTSEFYKHLIGGHSTGDVNNPSFAIYEKQEGETMLGPGAVWQRIVDDPKQVFDDSDIQFILDYLSEKAHCDGFGPVFSLDDVNEGIRRAIAQKQL